MIILSNPLFFTYEIHQGNIGFVFYCLQCDYFVITLVITSVITFAIAVVAAVAYKSISIINKLILCIQVLSYKTP